MAQGSPSNTIAGATADTNAIATADLVVKLLELPAVELEDRIHAELLENPALEEGKEDAATDEYADGVSPEEGMDNDANDYDSLSDYLTEDDTTPT